MANVVCLQESHTLMIATLSMVALNWTTPQHGAALHRGLSRWPVALRQTPTYSVRSLDLSGSSLERAAEMTQVV